MRLTATPLFSSSLWTSLTGMEKDSESWQPLCSGSEGVMMWMLAFKGSLESLLK